jgi:N4-gp56 family major capsid protein
MAVNTTTLLSNTVSVYYDKFFLERYKAALKFGIGATKKRIPANSGKTITFNRMDIPTLATTPLTEGTTPVEVNLTTTQIVASIKLYGTFVKTSDFYEETSIDSNLAEQVSTMSQIAAETANQVMRQALTTFLTVPGSAIQRAGSKTTDQTILAADVLTGAEIRRAVRTLKLNKAMPFEDQYFKSIIPVECAYDLRGSADWISANTYVNKDNWESGEIGRLHGVAFYETNDTTVTAGGTVTATQNFAPTGTVATPSLSITGTTVAPIYETFVFGKGAYACVEVEGADAGKDSIIIYKKSDSSDTSNPLNLFSTIGWKLKFAAVMTNSLWSIGIRSSATQ